MILKNPRSKAGVKISTLESLTVLLRETREYDEAVGEGLKDEVLKLAYMSHQTLVLALLKFAEVCICEVMDRHLYSKIFAPVLLACLNHHLPEVTSLFEP